MFYSVVANQRQPQYTYSMFYSVGANLGQLLYIFGWGVAHCHACYIVLTLGGGGVEWDGVG